MLLTLDFAGGVPIYLQIRNEIVLAIADGALKAGERLPSIRMLALQSGINVMTVNKAYSLLKQEGYINADRRSGATVAAATVGSGLNAKTTAGLVLIAAEARLAGYSETDFTKLCARLYREGGKHLE